MEQTLYTTDYLSLKKRGDYVYVHESRSGGMLVAILIYDSSRPGIVLGRYEICPAHGDLSPQLCAITGGVEKGLTPIESAIEEIREEAGYDAVEAELESLGEIRPSKAADTRTYLYAFDAKGKVRRKAAGDGSAYERGSYCEWLGETEAIWCKDPLMAVMLARLAEIQKNMKGKTMQLEDYFDFLSANDIRIKGHRIGIESVLYEYVHRAQTPEDIAERFPTVSLEKIYATILYYWHNKEQVHAYLTEWIEHEDRMFEKQNRNPTPAMIRLRQIKAQRDRCGCQSTEDKTL